jgi:histidinol-phosphate aminotransferase
MPRPKPFIERLPVAAHGGIDYAELKLLGVSPDEITDFSVSVNPFGPPPGIESAIAGAVIDRYPDSGATGVREMLARKLGVAVGQIVVGSGSTEIIRLIATAYFGERDTVLVPQPTYSEYETACRIAGAQVLSPWLVAEPGFRLNIPGLKAIISERTPKGMFLCNPNNPTGEYISEDAVNGVVACAPDTLVIIDEAYLAFTGAPWASLELVKSGNVIIVRSMTKDFALPGLRLGYAVARDETISVLDRVKPPWNVSAVAQAAARHVLQSDGYLESCARKLGESTRSLLSGLGDLGLETVPSQANFFLVRVGDAPGFRQALLGQGILVRDCSSFGLPRHIRLAPRTTVENRKLLEAIRTPEVMSHVR